MDSYVSASRLLLNLGDDDQLAGVAGLGVLCIPKYLTRVSGARFVRAMSRLDFSGSWNGIHPEPSPILTSADIDYFKQYSTTGFYSFGSSRRSDSFTLDTNVTPQWQKFIEFKLAGDTCSGVRILLLYIMVQCHV